MKNWLLVYLFLLLNTALLSQQGNFQHIPEKLYSEFFNRISTDLVVQNEDVLDSTVYFIYDVGASDFDRETKTILFYNNKGQNEKGLIQDWNDDSGSWNDDEQYFNSYDNNDQLTESINQEWQNNAWVNTVRQTLKYQNSQITLLTFSEWANNAWADQFRISFQYNGTGNVTIRKTEEWKDNKWNNLSRTVSTYDNKGYLIKDINSMWDEGWVEFTQDLYTNNNDGFPTMMETQTAIGPDMWLPSLRTLFSYNNSNLITEETGQFYNLVMDNWDNQSRSTYKYDGNDNLTELLFEFYQGNNWVANERTTYKYDGNNNEIESLDEVWLNDQWVKESKLVSYYGSGTTSLSDIKQIEYRLMMPNPLHRGDFIYIDIDDASNMIMEVRNNNGQLINAIPFNRNIAYQFSEEVSSGIYFFTIRNNNQILISKKVIVL